MLLVRPQCGGEARRHRHIRNIGCGTKSSNVGSGTILPAGGEDIFEVQHIGGLPGIQFQPVIRRAACRLRQVVHHRQQARHTLRRQLQDTAIVQAGDDLAADNARPIHTAAFLQAQKDGQKRVPRPVDVDAEVQRKSAAGGIRHPHIADAVGCRDAGSERFVDLIAPAQAGQGRQPLRDEGLPVLRRVLPPEDENKTALRRLSSGHAHLHQTVLAHRFLCSGLALAIAADKLRAIRRVRPDKLTFVVERDRHTAVVEFQQQGIELLHSPALVRARKAGQPQDRGHRPIDNGRFGGWNRIQSPARRFHEGRFRLHRRRFRRADTDPADRSRGGVHIPRPAIGDDHPRTRRQSSSSGRGKNAGLAFRQALPAGMPARATCLDQPVQHIGHQIGRDTNAGLPALPQQKHQVANRAVGGLVGCEVTWVGGGDDAAAFPDPHRNDDAGVFALGRRQFEHQLLPFLVLNRCGEGIEEGLLLRPAQRRKPVEGGERRGGQMRARPGPAATVVVEHHAAAHRGRHDPHCSGEIAVLYGAQDGIALQPHIHRAGQSEAPAARQRSGVENAAQVLRGIRRRHRLASPAGMGDAESRWTGREARHARNPVGMQGRKRNVTPAGARSRISARPPARLPGRPATRPVAA